MNIEKKNSERIDVFKHMITEVLSDTSHEAYEEAITKVVKSTCDILLGKKKLEELKTNQFYVEFLLNHKDFFKDFIESKELNFDSIKSKLPELLEIFNSWKSQSEIIEELNNKYVRLYSEFDNYKKRVIREKEEFSHNLKVKLNKDLISILDDLTIAKNSLSEEAKSGVELIYSKLEKHLADQSIIRVNINKGDLFNSEISECIAAIPSAEFKDGQIVDILKNSWSLDGKVVKYGQVVVCKN